MHMNRHANCEIQRTKPRAITARPYEAIEAPTECIRQVWGAASQFIMVYPPGAWPGTTAERWVGGGATAPGRHGRLGGRPPGSSLPHPSTARLQPGSAKSMAAGGPTAARFAINRADLSDSQTLCTAPPAHT